MAPDYRTPRCAYCDDPSRSPCPRCGFNACAQHRLDWWCTLCERERVDERDFAVATAKLRSPTMIDNADGDYIRGGSMASSFNLLSILVHVITRPVRTWRAAKSADRDFARRTSAEIEAWRRHNAPDARR